MKRAANRIRRETFGEAFVIHSLEMRESWAWRALPDAARRVLDRLELEHMQHGGAENGSLIVTYGQFAGAGIRRSSVSLALRQCAALGFLVVERRGKRAAAEFRAASMYRLTYLVGRGSSPEPTHEWRTLASEADALNALRGAETKRPETGDIDSRHASGSSVRHASGSN